MDITVYLPDDLGGRAKEAELPFSQLLRQAVIDELERRNAVSKTLDEIQVHEVRLDDGTIGRVTGKELFEEGDYRLFLTDDERLLAYDGRTERAWTVEDVEELREHVSVEAYVLACVALGVKPVIDL